MTTFLLKLTLCWGFFALLYSLLLRKETFFRANRIYLLGTAALGILLASWPAEQLPVPVDDGGLPVIVMPEFTVGIQQVETVANTWQDMDLLWMAYWAGFAWMLARVLWGLFKIVQMAINGRSEQLADGCLLIQTAAAKVPFSFFRWVFVPMNNHLSESSDNHQLMLAHERAHAHSWHSADVLFAEVLCVIFWFHPLAHWYRKALRTVHEYQADAEAARLADRKQYGLLLIGQSQSGMPIAFANHFFQSPLKQRLIMLTKKASTPIRALKFGLLAPLALLFAMLFRQAPAIAQVVDEKHLVFVRQLEARNWMLTDTVVTFDPKTYEETMRIVQNSAAPEVDENGKLVYQYTEIQPQFPGGQEALFKFLTDHLNYPEAAKKAGAEGIATVRFVVNQDGTISKVRAIATSGFNMRDDLLEESERVVRSMPKWIPAQHKSKAVSCIMNLPIKFKLDQGNPKELFDVDVQPEFPGGLQELYNFLTKEVKYPEAAKKAGAEGMEVITFIVEADGNLSTFEAVKIGRQDFSDEVIRVLKLSPNWTPASKDGKAVRVKYTLPFKFKLGK